MMLETERLILRRWEDSDAEDMYKYTCDPDGSSGAPCGACRKLMVQLMPGKYKDIKIMMDYKQERIMTMGELTPEGWIG